MIYLDTTAVVKLVRVEAETPALVAWLNDRAGIPLLASAMVEVEAARALWHSAPAAISALPAALARLHRIEIDATIRAAAANFPEPEVRVLDAIQLATALQIPRLHAFVTYDARLFEAARQAHLPATRPLTATAGA